MDMKFLDRFFGPTKEDVEALRSLPAFSPDNSDRHIHEHTQRGKEVREQYSPLYSTAPMNQEQFRVLVPKMENAAKAYGLVITSDHNKRTFTVDGPTYLKLKQIMQSSQGASRA